jgi:hypothetical protein
MISAWIRDRSLTLGLIAMFPLDLSRLWSALLSVRTAGTVAFD